MRKKMIYYWGISGGLVGIMTSIWIFKRIESGDIITSITSNIVASFAMFIIGLCGIMIILCLKKIFDY